jgi:rhomboid protease GluP
MAVFGRKKTGSVLCTSCGVLVGVNDETCYNCGRRNPALWGFAPVLRELGGDLGLVTLIMGANVIVFALALLRSVMLGVGINLELSNLFSFLGPASFVNAEFGASGVAPVVGNGRWWTVLSAGWLHAGILHIGFNMMALRQLGPPIAELYGPGRMVIIYIAGSAAGFALSTLAGLYFPHIPLLGAGTVTIGASAAIAGLVGALWHYGHRGANSMARQYANTFVVYMIIIGLAMPGIDNWAHFGGLAGGYGMGRLLDPLKRERTDHVLIALCCLAVSLASVAVSFFMPLEPRG